MEIALWTGIFIVSLAALVKGADWLLMGARKVGLALGLPPFIVGVTLVGIGTSLPELLASTVAALKGLTDVAVANAVGSNIANILLVVGALAIFSRTVVVKKDLIDLDLPLLAVSTVLFVAVVVDRQVGFGEAILLLATYGIYLGYTMSQRKIDEREVLEAMDVPRHFWYRLWPFTAVKMNKMDVKAKDIIYLIAGAALLALGAKFTIDSVIELSALLGIVTGVIAMLGIAFGTSLPEVIVSFTAARQGEADVALGNIMGSSVFNLLMVVGVPGLLAPLVLGEQTFLIGVPMLVAATTLFIISGISRRIHLWDGSMYLVLYAFFVGKVLGLI